MRVACDTVVSVVAVSEVTDAAEAAVDTTAAVSSELSVDSVVAVVVVALNATELASAEAVERGTKSAASGDLAAIAAIGAALSLTVAWALVDFVSQISNSGAEVISTAVASAVATSDVIKARVAAWANTSAGVAWALVSLAISSIEVTETSDRDSTFLLDSLDTAKGRDGLDVVAGGVFVVVSDAVALGIVDWAWAEAGWCLTAVVEGLVAIVVLTILVVVSLSGVVAENGDITVLGGAVASVRVIWVGIGTIVDGTTISIAAIATVVVAGGSNADKGSNCEFHVKLFGILFYKVGHASQFINEYSTVMQRDSNVVNHHR